MGRASGAEWSADFELVDFSYASPGTGTADVYAWQHTGAFAGAVSTPLFVAPFAGRIVRAGLAIMGSVPASGSLGAWLSLDGGADQELVTLALPDAAEHVDLGIAFAEGDTFRPMLRKSALPTSATNVVLSLVVKRS